MDKGCFQNNHSLVPAEVVEEDEVQHFVLLSRMEAIHHMQETTLTQEAMTIRVMISTQMVHATGHTVTVVHISQRT